MISELNQSVRPWWASDPQRNHWDRELFGELPNEAAENPKPFRPIATAECILCNRLLEIDHSLWLRKSSRNQPKEAIRKSPPDAARMPCALVSRREALGEQRCESVGFGWNEAKKWSFGNDDYIIELQACPGGLVGSDLVESICNDPSIRSVRTEWAWKPKSISLRDPGGIACQERRPSKKKRDQWIISNSASQRVR